MPITPETIVLKFFLREYQNSLYENSQLDLLQSNKIYLLFKPQLHVCQIQYTVIK